MIRRTEDWANLTPEEYRQIIPRRFSFYSQEGIDHIIRNIDCWNRTMRLNYPAYRARLTAIARQSWEATRLPIIRSYEPSDTPMYPTDDDDWFHPHIRRETMEAFKDPDVSVVMWRPWCCFSLSGHRVYEGHVFQKDFSGSIAVGKTIPSSNSYAVRMNTPRHVIFDHGLVKPQHLPAGQKIAYIDKPLSVWVFSAASLYNTLAGVFDPDKVGFLPAAPIPAELEWCRPYYEQLLELNEMAKPKRVAYL